MKPKDGGAAFPGTDENTEARHRGMSLRDYFAAKALQGLIAKGGFKDESASMKEQSAWCYLYADAMLKAREVDHD